ncbi:uncharacterized protein KY384_005373 [Bacidia gigantensis]|uniref:uncharacterized protein n=1 Tax=Bacidia gigantensis TaxID=2732470 RepID=UPI001D04D390|nr:uncharacterized protein KY384_005373 [Bacidia gigantensis]KAG8529892.1 hypothetical protein KY384_005373 [Bacidia gigantensis]
MGADVGLGSVSLALSVLSRGQVIIEFLIEWVRSSKHYGEDVRVIRTRLSTQSARLSAFSAFLEKESKPGVSHFNELSDVFRRSICGMTEELELTFDSYYSLINKYKIEDLQRGFETQMVIDESSGPTKKRTSIVAASKKESEARQKAASFRNISTWGLFRKKNVFDLINKIESWNDQLQNFLICGLCFGKGPRIGEMLKAPGLGELRVDIGIELRGLILEDPRTLDDYLKTEWILSRLEDETDPRIQTLTTRSPDQSLPTSRKVFVEYKEFRVRRGGTGPSESVLRGVSSLAKLLSQPRAPEAGFQTLKCNGIIRQTAPRQRFAFIFDLHPDQLQGTARIISIAQAISTGFAHRPTLGERFCMAKSLAVSLFQFHSVNWLHKSVRSSNVLFTSEEAHDGPPRPGFSRPFLVGFEFARAENDMSTTDQEDSVLVNIYRHPDKQGPPEERFHALHDIYALGTVLLEIGIWRPLIGFDRNFEKMKPLEVKQCLEAHARERLPHYMGVEYTEAVLSCLQGTLLDDEAEDAGDVGSDAWREYIQSGFWVHVIEKIHKGTGLK